MYDKKKCDVTYDLHPSPVTNYHTYLDPLPPYGASERDVLYQRSPVE